MIVTKHAMTSIGMEIDRVIIQGDDENMNSSELVTAFIRNGFMPHIMGHKLSHIYAREVR